MMMRRGRPSDDRRTHRAVARVVPYVMLVAVAFNLATFDSYADAQGARWGFRPGQSDDLADRIRSSGNTLLKEGWHLHLRIGDLVEDSVLELPRDHPFDEASLTYLARVEWDRRPGPALSMQWELISPLLDDAAIWANSEGVPIALVPPIQDGDGDRRVFRVVRIEDGDEREAQWMVLTHRQLTQVLGEGDVDR